MMVISRPIDDNAMSERFTGWEGYFQAHSIPMDTNAVHLDIYARSLAWIGFSTVGSSSRGSNDA